MISNDESEIIETTTIEPPQTRRLIDTILSNLLPTPPSVPEYEIAKSDMIEIEVPIIGSEFITRKIDESDSKVVDNHTAADDRGEEEEIAAKVREVSGGNNNDIEMTDNNVELNDQQPLASSHFHNNIHHAEIMTEIQDKITERAATTTAEEVMEIFKKQQKIPALMDDDGRLYALKRRSSLKLSTPVNVKIYVNNVDEKKSCKTKSTCNQVSFGGKTKAERERDIDLQYYTEYSDEDLNFTDLQSSNGLRSRNAKRAAMPADDQILPITPAPRFSPILPALQPLQLPAFKTPAIFERLASETSAERSERIHKDLDNAMKFVSVWAHVDKFVSERARTAIRKLAYLSDGVDYDDGGSLLGSSRRSKGANSNKNTDDDPFT